MNKQSDLKEFLENIGTKAKDAYKAVSDRASLYYNMAPDVWNRAGYGGLGGILIGGLIGVLSDGWRGYRRGLLYGGGFGAAAGAASGADKMYHTAKGALETAQKLQDNKTVQNIVAKLPFGRKFGR